MANKKQILKTVFFTPGINGWGLPIIFEGPPGTAKSSIVEEAAASFGLHCETVIASLREPADFLGLPVPNGGRVDYLPPGWAYAAKNSKGAVVFLDELRLAPPAVQAALLRCVLDRKAGDLDLGKHVRFIAAQNSQEHSAGGWDISPPLANRFGHLPWEAPDVGSWTQYLLTGMGSERAAPMDAEAIEKKVMENWHKPFAMAKGIVTGFLRHKQDELHNMPKGSGSDVSKAWPSPRSWEMATRALAGCDVHGLDQVDKDELLAAFVGRTAAENFITFSQNADLPDPEEVLDGKVKFKHDKKRLDRTAAAMQSCAAFLTTPKLPKLDARTEKMYTIMCELASDGEDLIVPAAVAMIANKLGQTTPAAHKLFDKIHVVLKASGYTHQNNNS